MLAPATRKTVAVWDTDGKAAESTLVGCVGSSFWLIACHTRNCSSSLRSTVKRVDSMAVAGGSELVGVDGFVVVHSARVHRRAH